ncbi:uncharacterized protein LOC128553979 [Mercenaria mercenaria]|uniref:uncharacterized protein LOC128553979 n=1 Tax=Mercenaria mercenaria TaxID=6596 RepID=UPI00234E4B5D|nr:uncharacterized protein LOC128553979 [Mercenaria mercenaria]
MTVWQQTTKPMSFLYASISCIRFRIENDRQLMQIRDSHTERDEELWPWTAVCTDGNRQAVGSYGIFVLTDYLTYFLTGDRNSDCKETFCIHGDSGQIQLQISP